MIELKPVENVELFDEALYAGGDQVVGEVVAVYLQDGGHDQQVAARVEDVLELVRGVDDGGQTVSGTGRWRAEAGCQIRPDYCQYRNTSIRLLMFSSSISELFPSVPIPALALCAQRPCLRMTLSPAWRARLPLSTLRKSWMSSGWAKLPAIASNMREISRIQLNLCITSTPCSSCTHQTVVTWPRPGLETKLEELF